MSIIRIRYFAWLRDRLGRAEEEIVLPDGVRRVDELLGWLGRRDAAHEAALSDRRTVRAAVNQEFVSLDAPIQGGDEVAFFPPVTGG